MTSKVRSLLRNSVSAAIGAIVLLTSCHSVDDDRIPPMPVRISFATYGDWSFYGIAGATDTRRFILPEKIPAGFPYTAMSATGFGGVLLVGQYSYSGDPTLDPPLAYDLACPVEMKSDIRVYVDQDKLVAKCPRCESTYDIFQGYGGPLSGPAAEHGYGLKRYRAGSGSTGQYMIITN